MELARVLHEDPVLTRKLEERIHRTVLWRWSTGRGFPSVKLAFLAEKLSEGRLPASGWVLPEVAA